MEISFGETHRAPCGTSFERLGSNIDLGVKRSCLTCIRGVRETAGSSRKSFPRVETLLDKVAESDFRCVFQRDILARCNVWESNSLPHGSGILGHASNTYQIDPIWQNRTEMLQTSERTANRAFLHSTIFLSGCRKHSHSPMQTPKMDLFSNLGSFLGQLP